MEKKFNKNLRILISNILWEDWDPIGVNTFAPRDEYESYVEEIADLVEENNNEEKIAEELHRIENETMGMKGNMENCSRVAEKIVEETKKILITEQEAYYAATIEKEFEKSVKLLSGEKIELKKRAVIFKEKSIFQSPGMVAITNKRIILLKHHFFSPDKIISIPLAIISKADIQKFGLLRSNQTAIRIKCGEKYILFGITYIQKIATGLTDAVETMKFLEKLKEKL
jgi:hypothetical protein